MKIKNLQITSPTSVDLDLPNLAPICIFRGENSSIVLDLIRETLGDYGAGDTPDCLDDGRFVINSDIEIDGKNYAVCYIRNADYMGDNRIAANFVPNGFDFSRDDTAEFVDKCNKLDVDDSNVFTSADAIQSSADERPVFVYASDLDDGNGISECLRRLLKSGKQVFAAVPFDYLPIELEGAQNVILR